MNKEIQFNYGKISFSDSGKGSVVVLLHGFLGSKELFAEVQNGLAKVFRVISIDLPGHGESDCFGYVHSMELMAKSIKAVMDSLKLKKYVLIGHSMGGYAALAFAELFFENVKGLCLFHSTAYADTDQKKSDRKRAIKAVKSNHNLYVNETIAGLFAHGGTENASALSFAKSVAKKTSRRGIAAALEGMMRRPHRDLILYYAKYPVMIISGKHDKVLHEKDIVEQAEMIKSYPLSKRAKKLVVLQNSGHMGFLEEPLLSVKELKRFARAAFFTPAHKRAVKE